ncbi:diaminopimelate epimerase [Lapillicoccus sp.]|uniref:diaminopimelate epimerase n=1 Tax=Lapillicoccus sp. TaxID=1909287 RepID=UPI0032649C57
MSGVRFTKGHGTQNDFVLVPDLDGAITLTRDQVVLLADRRAGIGGDGVIRIVPTTLASEPAVREQAAAATWFMDYSNADGSVAEMCGNGTRVFAAYLRREGLETQDEFGIATRAGVRSVKVTGEQYAVDLGPWHVVDPDGARERGFGATVRARGGVELPALLLDLGNPHTVVILPPEIGLDDLDLTEPPAVSPHPEYGTNVEFVTPISQGHIAMRVHERGVGETRSCGTGAAAAALATRWWEGESADNTEWVVDVPGGRLTVTALPDQHVELAGPAVLVADGTVTLLD